LIVPRDQRGTHRLGDRHRLPGDHRFVDAALAFEDRAVDRNLLAGPNPQGVADQDILERNFFVFAIGPDPPRAFR
jgi:hypothetical protein